MIKHNIYESQDFALGRHFWQQDSSFILNTQPDNAFDYFSQPGSAFINLFWN